MRCRGALGLNHWAPGGTQGTAIKGAQGLPILQSFIHSLTLHSLSDTHPDPEKNSLSGGPNSVPCALLEGDGSTEWGASDSSGYQG